MPILFFVNDYDARSGGRGRIDLWPAGSNHSHG